MLALQVLEAGANALVAGSAVYAFFHPAASLFLVYGAFPSSLEVLWCPLAVHSTSIAACTERNCFLQVWSKGLRRRYTPITFLTYGQSYIMHALHLSNSTLKMTLQPPDRCLLCSHQVYQG